MYVSSHIRNVYKKTQLSYHKEMHSIKANRYPLRKMLQMPRLKQSVL